MSTISIFSIKYFSTDGNPTNQKIEIINLCSLQAISGGGTKYFPMKNQLKSLATNPEIFQKRMKCDLYCHNTRTCFSNCDYFTTIQIKNIKKIEKL